VAAILAVSLTAAQQPPAEPEAAAPPRPPATEQPQGRLEGTVLAKDGKTTVAGAVVRVSHLRTGTKVDAPPTNARGEFALGEVPYGYLDLVVETAEGGFVASQVINVPPDSKVSVTLVLMKNEEMPQEWWAGRQPRALPGSGTPAVGVANVREDARGFFSGKKGIVLLGAAGALALLSLAGGGGDETPASPSSP
jgi:hypothetical protein